MPRNTLTSINILAELLHAQGKDAEAEPYCIEVKNGFLAVVGPDHPFTVSAAENLCGVLNALGKKGEAEAVSREFKLEERKKQVEQARGQARARAVKGKKGGSPSSPRSPPKGDANGTSEPIEVD